MQKKINGVLTPLAFPVVGVAGLGLPPRLFGTLPAMVVARVGTLTRSFLTLLLSAFSVVVVVVRI